MTWRGAARMVVLAGCLAWLGAPSGAAASRLPAAKLIRDHTITGRQVKAGSLPGADITRGTLGAGALAKRTIGQGLVLSGGVLGVNPLLLDPFQKRVTGACSIGQAIRVINADGSVGCQPTTGGGGGTVSSLSQGAGISLLPNPLTSTGTISADFGSVQARVTGTPCASGQAITAIAQSGAATCTAVGGGSSGVSSIAAGTGLSENQSTGAVTLNLDDPLSLSGSRSQAILEGVNSGAGDGLHGQTADGGFTGVFGDNTAGGKGVFGASASGHGVEGIGGSAGVYGTTRSSSTGYGVQGNGGAVGVWGTGSAFGVNGDANGANGVGVGGSGSIGVVGKTTNSAGYGVLGYNTGGGTGIDGYTSGNGFSAGVEGDNTTSGLGVYGNSTSGTGVAGLSGVSSIEGGSVGAQGISASGTGVYGESAGNSNSIAIEARNRGSGTGVYGSAGSGFGVQGISASNYGVLGVYGNTTILGSSPSGVYGYSFLGNGVEGVTSADGQSGVYGESKSASGNYAGWFAGNVEVTGTLTAGSKNFRIDDPADPANKFLVHTSVESPYAENVYNGNITTDRRGYATVRLPAYFDAENIDPRYQLTVIGSFAHAVVWTRERHDRFLIRTDQPRAEVSWQVMGIRNDPYARSQRGPAEQLKPVSERGRYLYPQGYGEPARLAVGQ
jgi:hypothetical protein